MKLASGYSTFCFRLKRLLTDEYSLLFFFYFQDIGCFMSPGERSYDAIGLMKHLSEHTATAYADALEVLGNDTPETILKKRQLNKSIQGKENQLWPHDQLENQSQVAASTVA